MFTLIDFFVTLLINVCAACYMVSLSTAAMALYLIYHVVFRVFHCLGPTRVLVSLAVKLLLVRNGNVCRCNLRPRHHQVLDRVGRHLLVELGGGLATVSAHETGLELKEAILDGDEAPIDLISEQTLRICRFQSG